MPSTEVRTPAPRQLLVTLGAVQTDSGIHRPRSNRLRFRNALSASLALKSSANTRSMAEGGIALLQLFLNAKG